MNCPLKEMEYGFIGKLHSQIQEIRNHSVTSSSKVQKDIEGVTVNVILQYTFQRKFKTFFQKMHCTFSHLKTIFSHLSNRLYQISLCLNPRVNRQYRILPSCFQSKHKHVAGDVNFEAQKAEVEVTHTKVESEAER